MREFPDRGFATAMLDPPICSFWSGSNLSPSAVASVAALPRVRFEQAPELRIVMVDELVRDDWPLSGQE